MNAADKLVTELARNEHVIHVAEYEALVKEWEARKDLTKTASGYVAVGNDLAIARKIISDFGLRFEKAVIRTYKGKKYIIFKGYAGQRKYLRGTRYLLTNPNIVRMAIGPKGIKNSVKGGFVITAVLSTGIEVANYLLNDTATLHQLLGTVTADLVKIGIASICAAIAGVLTGGVSLVASAPAAPLLAAVVVGVATGLVLNKIDKHFGATKALIDAYQSLGVDLRKIKYETNSWLRFFEENPCSITQIFGGPVISGCNRGY